MRSDKLIYLSIMANLLKNRGAKLKGLRTVVYGSQLPNDGVLSITLKVLLFMSANHSRATKPAVVF